MTESGGGFESWDPEAVVLGASGGADLRYALLVLNRPILGRPDAIVSLWKNASLRVAVDGGSNRWLEFCERNKLDLRPDLITGDFDSARKETLDFYEKQGSVLIKTLDQDETDFTKALKEAAAWFAKNNIKADAVISLVETSGRIDQILANINTLFKARSFLDCPVFQLGSESVSWLLSPGRHRIVVPERLRGKVCSLVPIGAAAKCVTTTGLKWNLDNQEMRFGELISTSNTYSETMGDVTVVTDSELLWSMELT